MVLKGKNMPHLYTWILLYSTDLQYAKIHRMNLSLGYILKILSNFLDRISASIFVWKVKRGYSICFVNAALDQGPLAIRRPQYSIHNYEDISERNVSHWSKKGKMEIATLILPQRSYRKGSCKKDYHHLYSKTNGKTLNSGNKTYVKFNASATVMKLSQSQEDMWPLRTKPLILIIIGKSFGLLYKIIIKTTTGG